VTFGKLRGKLNDNIKTYYKGIELGVRNGLIWLRIWDKLMALVNTAINFQVTQNAVNFFTIF
jgi:hypothetical protein